MPAEIRTLATMAASRHLFNARACLPVSLINDEWVRPQVAAVLASPFAPKFVMTGLLWLFLNDLWTTLADCSLGSSAEPFSEAATGGRLNL